MGKALIHKKKDKKDILSEKKKILSEKAFVLLKDHPDYCILKSCTTTDGHKVSKSVLEIKKFIAEFSVQEEAGCAADTTI